MAKAHHNFHFRAGLETGKSAFTQANIKINSLYMIAIRAFQQKLKEHEVRERLIAEEERDELALWTKVSPTAFKIDISCASKCHDHCCLVVRAI
eukprot:6211149-Amphidinium_carterae.1